MKWQWFLNLVSAHIRSTTKLSKCVTAGGSRLLLHAVQHSKDIENLPQKIIPSSASQPTQSVIARSAQCLIKANAVVCFAICSQARKYAKLHTWELLLSPLLPWRKEYLLWKVLTSLKQYQSLTRPQVSHFNFLLLFSVYTVLKISITDVDIDCL